MYIEDASHLSKMLEALTKLYLINMGMFIWILI